jgi:hypothetical protein
VIVPTRELAVQTYEWFQKLCRTYIWIGKELFQLVIHGSRDKYAITLFWIWMCVGYRTADLDIRRKTFLESLELPWRYRNKKLT